jgi:hypothetical protein
MTSHPNQAYSTKVFRKVPCCDARACDIAESSALNHEGCADKRRATTTSQASKDFNRRQVQLHMLSGILCLHVSHANASQTSHRRPTFQTTTGPCAYDKTNPKPVKDAVDVGALIAMHVIILSCRVHPTQRVQGCSKQPYNGKGCSSAERAAACRVCPQQRAATTDNI